METQIYKVRDPQGNLREIRGPAGASDAEVIAQAQALFGGGQAPSRQLSPEQIAKQQARSMASMTLADKPWYERAVLGAGASAKEMVEGIKGLMPGYERSTENQMQLDAAKQLKDQSTAASLGGIGLEAATLAAPGGALMRSAQALKSAPVLGRALTAAGRAPGMTTAGNLAAAGGSSALLSAAVAPEDRGEAALMGGIGGAVGEGAGRVLKRTLGGVPEMVSPKARELMSQGIEVPAWKATENQAVRGIAERAKVLPFTNAAMRQQERTAMESYTRKLMNDSLPPVPVTDDAGKVLRWEKAKPVQQAGTEGLQQVDEAFDKAYGALYGNRGIPVDNRFEQEIAKTLEDAKAYLPSTFPDIEGLVKRARNTIAGLTDETVKKTGGGPVGQGKVSSRLRTPVVTETTPGREVAPYANIREALNDLKSSIDEAWRKGDKDKADALSAVRKSIEDLRQRGLPPEVASEAKDINAAYAKYKTLQKASSTLGVQKQGGVITPAQQLNAIRARDRSPDKSRFALGTAPGQEEALAANEVLGSVLPDIGPGTGEKVGLLEILRRPALGVADLGASWMLGGPVQQRLLMGAYPWQESSRRINENYLIPALRNVGMASGN